MRLKDFRATLDRHSNYRFYIKTEDPDCGVVKEEVGVAVQRWVWPKGEVGVAIQRWVWPKGEVGVAVQRWVWPLGGHRHG